MRRFWMIVVMIALGTMVGRAQQSAPAADGPVPADQWKEKGITPPVLIKSVEAQFSDEARAKKINGRCMVSLDVDVKGKPQEIKLIRCSDPSFANNSLITVARYRFKPATNEDGKPVEVNIRVVINYRLLDGFIHPLDMPIRFSFNSPPGALSTEPDSDGVYLLTKNTNPPAFSKFSDEGYGDAAFNSSTGDGACDIVLTISEKGEASDPRVIHCERPKLEEPAIESLLKSKYKPGSVNGKAVAIRASVHLEYGDAAPKP